MLSCGLQPAVYVMLLSKKKIYEVSKDYIYKSLYYRKKVDTITSFKNRLILQNFSDIAIFKNNQKNYVFFLTYLSSRRGIYCDKVSAVTILGIIC